MTVKYVDAMKPVAREGDMGDLEIVERALKARNGSTAAASAPGFGVSTTGSPRRSTLHGDVAAS